MNKIIKKNCPLIILALLLLFLSFGVPQELKNIFNNMIGKAVLLIGVIMVTKKYGLLHGCLAGLCMIVINNSSLEGFSEDIDDDEDDDGDEDEDDIDDEKNDDDEDDDEDDMVKKIKQAKKVCAKGNKKKCITMLNEVEKSIGGGDDEKDNDGDDKESFLSRQKIAKTFKKLLVSSKQDIRLSSAAQRVQSNLNTLTASI